VDSFWESVYYSNLFLSILSPTGILLSRLRSEIIADLVALSESTVRTFVSSDTFISNVELVDVDALAFSNLAIRFSKISLILTEYFLQFFE